MFQTYGFLDTFKKNWFLGMYQSTPNCIKDFLDLLGDFGQSGLTLQLFPMVILAIQG